MMPLSIPFSVVGLVAVMYLLYIFAALSRRLGAVTKMKPYYRGFYGAMFAVAVAAVASVLRQSGSGLEGRVYLFIYHLPLVAAGLISLVVAYRYWGWLFLERLK